MVSIRDKVDHWIREYAKTGWKVALLQAMIFLVYLGIIATSKYFFGDVSAPEVNSFLDYLLFPVAIIVLFTAYLILNGAIARHVFKWK